MKNTGGPLKSFPLAERAREAWNAAGEPELPNFSDSELTFSHLSDARLRGTRWLFRLMALPWLTRVMGSVGLKSVELGLPGAEWGVRKSVYRQFVGGESLPDAIPVIDILAGRNVDSILDYGAEGKDSAAGMQSALQESLRATEFAGGTPAVIGSVVKLSSLFPASVLERYNDQVIDFNDATDRELNEGLSRLAAVCSLGRERGCEIYLDAEESWIQGTIDQIAERMMSVYNREHYVVFTTCQMYRHDRLQYLKALHLRARQNNYKVALKIVRGAYMVKERKRAAELGYESPIQVDLPATHRDFDAAAVYCLEHRDHIACCVATHNELSIVGVITRMQESGIPRDHPSIRFSQLLGMSGNLTFNLAEGGYHVSKYMVYGPVKEVFPYLLRRAQENASVTGETGRELRLITEEVRRRAKR